MLPKEIDSNPDGNLNPYEAPGIERLHHTSIYQWPMPADKSLSFEVDIGDTQLLKCIVDNHRLVTLNFLGALSSGVVFLITGFGSLVSMRMGFTMPLICMVSFVTMWYFARRSSHASYLKQLRKQFYWMWGKVHVKVDSDGIHWTSDNVKLLQHWDSFHQLTWWRNCIWLSTNHPFAMEIPIHREWVDEVFWGELRQIGKSHKGFYEKEDFWKMVRAAPAPFKDAGPPDLVVGPDGAKPFRASGLGGKYGSEVTASFMQEGGRHWTILLFVLFSLGLLSPYGRELDYSLGITKNGYHMYLFYFILFFSSALSSLLRWNPAGIGFHQWSQSLLSSQSGFVSVVSVRMASPACCIEAKLGGPIFVRLTKDCLVLELNRKFGQSIVIPRDQFASLDAEKVWLSLRESDASSVPYVADAASV